MISTFLVAALCVSMLPQREFVKAAENSKIRVADEDKDGISLLDFSYYDVFEDEITKLNSPAKAQNNVKKIKSVYSSTYGAGLDSSYNTDFNLYTTSVKNQNQWESCWAFSAIAASETDLMKNEGVTNPDLSELQMFYYTLNPVKDPLGMMTSKDYVTNGKIGNPRGGVFQPIWSMASGMVGGYESVMPSYSGYFFGYSASSYADFSLSSSYAYKTNCYLNEANIYPLSDRDAVKYAIKEYGSVVAFYGSYLDTQNDETGNIYCPSINNSNHAVQVVGWDDNYSKTNFGVPGYNYQPSNNGAWIIKNSKGPSSGKSGYYYISYEDGSLQNYAVSYDVETKRVDGTKNGKLADNIYQYDFAYQNNGVRLAGKIAANVYQAKASTKEKLVAVSCSTAYADEASDLSGATDYTISIYTNLKDDTNPTSGGCAITMSGHWDYMGYHTVNLPWPVELDYGSKYAVVIKLKNNDNVHLLAEGTNAGYEFSNAQLSISKGQSFAGNIYDEWLDLYDTTEAKNYGLRNYCIKAFTDNAGTTPIKASSVTLNKTSFTTRPYDLSGNVYQLKATVNSTATNKTIRWTTSNSAVATVSSSGKVYIRGKGTATITATTVNGAKATCKVTIKDIRDTMAVQTAASANSVTISWKPLNATAVKKVKEIYGYSMYGYAIIMPGATSGSFKLLKVIKGTAAKNVTLKTYCNTKGKVYNLGAGMAKNYYVAPIYKKGSTYIYFYTNKAVSVTKPKKVTGVKKSSASKTAIKLKWTKSSGVTGYYVYAATSKNGTYKRVGTIKGASTNYFTYKNLKKNKYYYFKVYAYKTNAGKNYAGPASSIVAIKTAK